jgi:hypothetical protein
LCWPAAPGAAAARNAERPRPAAEILEQRIHRQPGSDLAIVAAAHAIGQREQKAQGSSLGFRIRREAAQIILVVIADPATIRGLRELDFQHKNRSGRG